MTLTEMLRPTLSYLKGLKSSNRCQIVNDPEKLVIFVESPESAPPEEWRLFHRGGRSLEPGPGEASE